MRLAAVMLVVLLGCRSVPVPRTQCPLLEEYARRESIPQEELRKHGTGWPQYVRDYSISHGPALTPAELREFTAWQVK